MRSQLLFAILFLCTYLAYAQQTVWTGNASNNDFFDEGNWISNSNNLPPAPNTINPDEAINLDLQLGNTSTISTNGAINLGTGSLSVTVSNLVADAISGGNVSITMRRI